MLWLALLFTAAAHAGRLTALWRREQPITLLYRPRQLAVLGPTVHPFAVPTVEDTLDLQRLYLDKGLYKGAIGSVNPRR